MCGWRAAQDHDVFFSHFTIVGKIKGALSKQRPPMCELLCDRFEA